ncbi:MAG TPA: hypothetical protein ENG66_07380 [Thermococcus sp.]|nr:hypothetical protein [Thermococcus sp.]
MIVCPYCVAEKGLNIERDKGKHLFETEEEFFDHLEMVHDLVVRRKGETDEQARKRVEEKQKKVFGYVRIGSENCQCPSCKAKRGLLTDVLVDALRGGK